jgi:hypothetical protein
MVLWCIISIDKTSLSIYLGFNYYKNKLKKKMHNKN